MQTTLGQINAEAILSPMSHLLPAVESDDDEDEKGLTMVAPVANTEPILDFPIENIRDSNLATENVEEKSV